VDPDRPPFFLADGAMRATVREATTGEVGSFVFEDLPPSTWSVEVEAPRHGLPAPRAPFPLVEGAEVELDLVVPPGHDIPGLVVYAGSDRRLEGGRILLRGPPRVGGGALWRREAPVSREGRFTLPGVPVEAFFGECIVMTAEGVAIRVGFPRPVVNPATGAVSGEVVVAIPWNSPAGLDYNGRITDARGAPVAGARVVVGNAVLRDLPRRDANPWGPPFGALTDADGRYHLPDTGYMGSRVLVLHPDHAPGYFELPYRSRTRTFDFVLGDPMALWVLVKDPSGRPAAGAEVRALLEETDPAGGEENRGDVLEGMRSTPVTDGGGRATVGPLGPGSWVLAARSPDGMLAGRVSVVLEEGGVGGVVELTLSEAPVMGGILVDLDDAPVAGVVVGFVNAFTGEGGNGRTGEDGRFTLSLPTVGLWAEVVTPVTLSLDAGADLRTGSRYRQVPSGSEVSWRVVRRADAPRDLVVHVVGGDGEPVMGFLWEMRFRGDRGGTGEGWGGEIPGRGDLTIPFVRGRGAVLTVVSKEGGARVLLDELPPGTTTTTLSLPR